MIQNHESANAVTELKDENLKSRISEIDSDIKKIAQKA